jgi:hypothetical protein
LFGSAEFIFEERVVLGAYYGEVVGHCDGYPIGQSLFRLSYIRSWLPQ